MPTAVPQHTAAHISHKGGGVSSYSLITSKKKKKQWNRKSSQYIIMAIRIISVCLGSHFFVCRVQ